MNDTACRAPTTPSAVTARPPCKRGRHEPVKQVHRPHARIDRDLSQLTEHRTDHESVTAVR